MLTSAEMSFRHTVRVMVAGLMGLVASVGLGGNMNATDECVLTRHSQVYSDAKFIEEAGDVVGFELALQPSNGHSIVGLLYDYEGVPNLDGISLSGLISGRKLTMHGSWVHHLVQEPSKKEIVETQLVRLDGTVYSSRFLGTVTFEGLDAPVNLRLKRVRHIWLCKR